MGADGNPVAVRAGVGVIAVSTNADTVLEVGLRFGPEGGGSPHTTVRVCPLLVRVMATECPEDRLYSAGLPLRIGAVLFTLQPERLSMSSHEPLCFITG